MIKYFIFFQRNATFKEDPCRVRTGYASKNLSLQKSEVCQSLQTPKIGLASKGDYTKRH